jgi:anti-sigma factor RsiW
MHPEETAINDYVDEALDPGARAELERHLASCASCRQRIADLREIVTVSSTLDDREPPVRGWSRLERAIALEPARTAGWTWREPFRSASAGSKAARYTWLAMAAAVVLAAAAGLRYAPFGARPGAAANAGAGVATAANRASTDALETEMLQAEQHYENAIKGLEQIASADQGTLDPRTAATLQSNLAVIDQAIGESRAAVRAQPASEPAQQSLIENFRTKVALLQDTVTLINEMRKGNDAGAARIASGLRTKGD